MKPGSLVVYIGGQTTWDILYGTALSKDEIYMVEDIGFAQLGVPAVKKKALSLVERPGEVHAITMFREIQPPGSVDFEELMKVPVKEKEPSKIKSI